MLNHGSLVVEDTVEESLVVVDNAAPILPLALVARAEHRIEHLEPSGILHQGIEDHEGLRLSSHHLRRAHFDLGLQ